MIYIVMSDDDNDDVCWIFMNTPHRDKWLSPRLQGQTIAIRY